MAAPGIEQVESALSADSRPLAALAVEAGDLPSSLEWRADEEDSTRFAIVRLGEWTFALETDDEEPKQTTVYGDEVGEALDQLLDALGVAHEAVIDRVDGRSEGDTSTALAEAVETAEAIRASFQDATAQLSAFEARLAREAYNRDLAAMVDLWRDELTDRERSTLSLVSAGWTTDDVAGHMGVTPETVRKTLRRVAARWGAARNRPATAPDDIPTLRRRVLAMRDAGMTLRDVASQLNAEGVPTLRGGAEWTPSSVQTAVRPRRVALSGPDALTTRERQVAQLASEGYSNRDIAKQLVITLKTVQWHLRQAYRKLGVTSREELEAAVDPGASGSKR